jgi:ATP-binding cassette subfamily F protein 3
MRELEAAKVVEEKRVEVKKEEKSKEPAPVQNYQEKKEQDKQQRKLQKKVEALEKQIEELDAEIEKMNTLLAENPQEATADFFEKYNALKKQQENVMWEWGKLIG